ncbi:unnamed protein product [Albugo candida]|uniref:Uncharacterized protein n=1 Tax=Albugo candida TaxID=65357 RepID=A0A024G3W8_9STRA|nr:unnamed protein product [Albugo candida]|eukprot:CCI41549.1 unnamed protein product [Albugo candida]
MCTLLRHFFLVLLQVLLYSSSLLGEKKCFIGNDAQCTRIKPSDASFFKFESKLSLNKTHGFQKYFCDHYFWWGQVASSIKQDTILNLGRNKLGKDCDTFRYTFYEDKLSLSTTYEPDFHSTIALKASASKNWAVKFDNVTVNGARTLNYTSLEFRLGDKTQLLTPSLPRHRRQKNKHLVSFNLRQARAIERGDSQNWILVIGPELSEPLTIAFLKKGKSFHVHIGNNTFEDKVALASTEQKKKKKTTAFFSWIRNKISGSSFNHTVPRYVFLKV